MGFFCGGGTVANSLVEDFARGVIKSSGALTGANDDGAKTKIDPISIMTVVVPFITQLVTWLKQCKGLRDDQVQGFVATRHGNDKTQKAQEKQVFGKLMAHCRKSRQEEVRNAKKLGIPADIGRFQIDDDTATRVCHNLIGNFAAINDFEVATRLVAKASTGG
jgi:hypothetical protein